MKRMTAILLILILMLSMLSFSSGATEVSGKIDPELTEKILAGEEGGEVVQIFFHYDEYPLEGVSQEESQRNRSESSLKLIRKLAQMTYIETFYFGPGCVNVGLHYNAMQAAAALDEVDAITPQSQYTDRSASEKMNPRAWSIVSGLDGDTELDLHVRFAYLERVFIGFDEESFEGSRLEYIEAVRAVKEAFYTKKNTEFMQPVLSAADIKEYNLYKNMAIVDLTTTASEIEKIAALKEIGSILITTIDGDPADTGELYEIDENDPIFYPLWKNCKDKFSAWIAEKEGVAEYDPADHGTSTVNTFYNFDVLYYKTDTMYAYRYPSGMAVTDDCYTNNTNEWMLVQAYVDLPAEGEDYRYMKIGSERIGSCRVLRSFKAGAQKYVYGLFIYDMTEDTFTPIEEANFSKYDDPEYTMGVDWEICRLYLGSRLGDADMDKEITVIDATAIQKYKANLKKANKISLGAADFDGDGVVSVIDATRIQKSLANIEETE